MYLRCLNSLITHSYFMNEQARFVLYWLEMESRFTGGRDKNKVLNGCDANFDPSSQGTLIMIKCVALIPECSK